MKSLFRRHPWLVLALVLATALTFFFAVRFAIGVVYWTKHHQEPVQAWMTLRYVSKSWDLDPRQISTTAGLPPPQHGHPVTFAEIARQRGVPAEDVVRDVEAAIASLDKAEKP